MVRWIVGIQAVYYLVSAVWPLVSMASFVTVTGPKADLWLVRTVSLLILVIAVTLGTAVATGRLSLEIIVCAVLSCLVFVAIDTVYALSGVISKIYLGDAAVEAVLLSAIIVGLRVDAHHVRR
jgi:hypothetical protein